MLPKLTAPAQAIQAALLADAEALAAAESLPGDDVAEVLVRLAERAGGLDDWRFRALAGAVARRLAEIEEWQGSEVDGARKELAAGSAEIHATNAALRELLFVAEKTWPSGCDELWDRHFLAVDAARLRLGLSPLAKEARQ